MGEVFFYHLTRSPVEVSLPQLLDRARSRGWHIVVRGTDPARMDWLDQSLWRDGGTDRFLAHGLAGGPHDALQPILLTVADAASDGARDTAANDPQIVMAIDGAPVAPDEVARLERVCILFDGNDDAAVQAARAQWKTLTDAGCAAQYWSEESGRWDMKARKG